MVHLPDLLGSHFSRHPDFVFRALHHFTLRCTPSGIPSGGSSDDDKIQRTTQDAHAVSWLWCRAKVISHWSSALARRTTHLTWVPREARAACRDTLAGCDLASICSALGLSGSGPRLFRLLPCRPFRQTGLARGGVRRGATKTSHRDGTGCDLRRCGGALPFPHTRLHISAGYPSGFLSCFHSNHTQLIKLPRLLSRLCHPHQPGLASGGLGQCTHTLTFALAQRLGGGFAPPTKQPSKVYRGDINSQARSRMSPSCNRLAVPPRSVGSYFGISLLFPISLDMR